MALLDNVPANGTRSEVIGVLGEPSMVRASRGETHVDEYRLFRKGTAMRRFGYGIILLTVPWWFADEQDADPVWFHYEKERLVKFGAPGDFQEGQTLRLIHGGAVAP